MFHLSSALMYDQNFHSPQLNFAFCVEHQMLLQHANKLLSPAKLSSLCGELATRSEAPSTYSCFNIRILNTDQPQQVKWTTLIMVTMFERGTLVFMWMFSIYGPQVYEYQEPSRTLCHTAKCSRIIWRRWIYDLKVTFIFINLHSRFNVRTNMVSWLTEGSKEVS